MTTKKEMNTCKIVPTKCLLLHNVMERIVCSGAAHEQKLSSF